MIFLNLFNESSETFRIGLESIEVRRTRGVLVLSFKMDHELVDIDDDDYFTTIDRIS